MHARIEVHLVLLKIFLHNFSVGCCFTNATCTRIKIKVCSASCKLSLHGFSNTHCFTADLLTKIKEYLTSCKLVLCRFSEMHHSTAELKLIRYCMSYFCKDLVKYVGTLLIA